MHLAIVGHHGQTSTIHRWRTAPLHHPSCASLRSPRTRRSTPIARCTLDPRPLTLTWYLTFPTRPRYYEGGVSSVYLWDLEDGGFAGVVLLKKSMTPSSPSEPAGSWDSIHVFETAERGRQVRMLRHFVCQCVLPVLSTGVVPNNAHARIGPLQAHVNCDAAADDAQELGEQG